MNSFLEEKTFELEVEKLERPCSAEKERGGVARYPWYRVLCKEIMMMLMVMMVMLVMLVLILTVMMLMMIMVMMVMVVMMLMLVVLTVMIVRRLQCFKFE